MTEVDWDQTSTISELLLGRRVVKVSGDSLTTDDGTVLRCGGCTAGYYSISELNDCDNVITKVEFDYQPTDDSSMSEEEPGFYRVFVYAENRKINLLTVTGDDGNGYYGTGYVIEVAARCT